MSDPFVSIIMRSYNEGWALRDTLPALAAQDYRHWELIVIDSGSTDGSVDLIRNANPRHFVQIQASDYNPSRVMNHGMRLARSDFGIFLNADATPQGKNWLRPLVSALQDPNTAAVYGRQIPRVHCEAVFAHDYERCFGPTRESRNWEHFFSMVSSGIRKDIWSKRGFLEKMQYSEDDEYTRWCRAQGYHVVYCPESVVMHSHNYTPAQAYKRSFGEARALAAVWQHDPAQINWPKTVLLGWLNDVRRDYLFCRRNRRLRELGHAARIRWSQRTARLTGFREGWHHYRQGTEDGGQKTVDGERRTVDGGQRTEDGGRRTVDGGSQVSDPKSQPPGLGSLVSGLRSQPPSINHQPSTITPPASPSTAPMTSKIFSQLFVKKSATASSPSQANPGSKL
jgi:rhamnosyltransferase